MKTSGMTLGRRGFLTAAMGAGIPGLVRGQEQQAAPQPVTWDRNPNVYHFKIGEVDAWTVSDAFLPFREGLGLMWPEEKRPAMAELLKQEGRGLDMIPLYVNVLVLRKGNEVVLFDAGFGGDGNGMLGWLRKGLESIGISPDQVTAGFLSHAHSDHLNGFVKDGKPFFPNAAFHLTKEELDFWRGESPDFSKSKRNKDQLPGMIRDVRANFDILQGNMATVKDGDELLDGLVKVEAAPGHTSGHACFRIRSGEDELLHLMDLAHHDLLMFADPDWTIAFDHDPELSVVTRKKFWSEAAAKGTRCYGFHLPWPGLGRIVKQGEGYRWSAEPWGWV